ncbi:MAG: hypothetical protein IJ801_06920 [Lachnospiraceae bacterium]|nr:hypothetical protein [Lachnospiraceae bacterium]
MEHNSYWILGMILLPFIGGVAGFYLGKRRKRLRNQCMMLIMVAELMIQGALFAWLSGYEDKASLFLEWLPGIRVIFQFDRIRLFLCMLSGLVFCTVLLFMKESMRQEAGSNRFRLFLMCTYGMVLGTLLAGSMWVLVVCVSLSALFLYPMVAHRKDDVVVRNAGIYLYFLIAAIAITHIGLLLIHLHTNTPIRIENGLMTGWEGNSDPAVAGGLLLFVGCTMFSGLFPLQLLVTRGSAYSIMEASALLSSMISRMGIYGLLILVASASSENVLYGRILLPVSLLTIVWGLLIALTSTDIRKILMGVAVGMNGFEALSISCMVFGREDGVSVLWSSFLMIPVSGLSLAALYMVALEQVRARKTYEIKGLIASGKGNPVLGFSCLIACASIGGVPGTAGFLAHSTLYTVIRTQLGWRWLMVFYIVAWAFLLTAVGRIFMKLFVSRKEETLRLLTPEETIVADEVVWVDMTKHPYLAGELMLVFFGLCQLVTGCFPVWSLHSLADGVMLFFGGSAQMTLSSYYNKATCLACGIASVLGILLYVNLVHGILLRAIRNKKNKQLQESMSED